MRVKDIPGFEGRYMVSDTGYVISLYHQFVDKAGRLSSRPSKALRSINDKKGYRQVALCGEDGSITQTFVHRLVAAAFCAPFRGEVVNHIDGNCRNNIASNLEWCSHHANTLHHHLQRKRVDLTATEIMEIQALNGKVPLNVIATRFNTTRQVVYGIVNRYDDRARMEGRKRVRLTEEPVAR